MSGALNFITTYQGVLTTIISFTAITISCLIFRNANLARKHSLENQIFSIKRDTRVCCSELVNQETDCLIDMENELIEVKYKLNSQYQEENTSLADLEKIIKKQSQQVKEIEEYSLRIMSKLNSNMDMDQLQSLLFEIEEKKIKSLGSATRSLKITKLLCSLILFGNDEYIKCEKLKEEINVKEEEINALRDFNG